MDAARRASAVAKDHSHSASHTAVVATEKAAFADTAAGTARDMALRAVSEWAMYKRVNDLSPVDNNETHVRQRRRQHRRSGGRRDTHVEPLDQSKSWNSVDDVPDDVPFDIPSDAHDSTAMPTTTRRRAETYQRESMKRQRRHAREDSPSPSEDGLGPTVWFCVAVVLAAVMWVLIGR